MTGLTRRGFLLSTGAFAGLVATGSLAHGLAVDSAFLRPPGIASEEDFLSRCIRCQKCLAVCHANIIQPLSVIDTIPGMATPTLDFTRNYCDFCSEANDGIPRCSMACPTGALKTQEGKPHNNGVAVINERSCIAWDWKGCTVCVDACPQEALTLNQDRRPVVDDSLCDGCGLCELICPSTSLRSYSDGSEEKGIAIVPIQEQSHE